MFSARSAGTKQDRSRGFFRPRLEALEERELLATLLVINTNDSGVGSLRQAILDSNASVGVTDTINFAIAGMVVPSIALTSALPTITDPVVIDGTSEPTVGLVELNGTGAGANANGLDVQAGSTALKGLVINRFGGHGIVLETKGSDIVQGCFVGTNTSGTAASANGLNGVWINGTSGNIIGGTTAGAGNVISGNGGDGVLVQGGAATGNVIQGNRIGVNVAGTAAIANMGDGGVVITAGFANTVGGTTAGAGNIISGNGGNGVLVKGGGASVNVIQGNRIGVNAAGTAAIANMGDGVQISAGLGNVVGDDRGDLTLAARNIISGNGGDGVHIKNASATDNVVTGNFIGVNAAGTAAIGNHGAGVELEGVVATFLGFKVVNVIGGNAIGVLLDNGAQGNAVVNNFIGVGADGVTPVGNLGQGVALKSSGTVSEIPVQENSIGGLAPGTGNIIAFNGQAGVAIFGMPLAGNGQANTGNRILGNSIFGNSTASPTTDVGIDLVATTTFPTDDGPTPNSPGGPHTGPNDLQNTPIISGAAVNRNNAGTIVAGSLNSTPNTTFRIEIFDNPTASPTGFGEGKTFLTFLNVTTDGNGNASLSANLTPTVPVGHFLTATATDPNGNTSEFSKAVQVGTAGADIVGRANEAGQWWVAQSTGSSFANRLWATWNPAVTWVDVVTGDFNGDGLTDIAGRVGENGQWWVALSTGSGFTTSLWTTWNPLVSWTDVVVGDFNGDGKSDIAGRDASTGNWWVALSNGSTGFTNQFWTTWNPNVTWADVSVGRFEGGTKDDIVGRASEVGQWWMASSTGSSFTNSLWATWSTAVTWVDVQVGDFNHDGMTDITGRANEIGQWWTGISNGSKFNTSLWATWSTAVTWVDVHVGDFNGDGNMDIVGRADEIGQWWAGISNGSKFTNQLWATWSTAVGWSDVQVGDFNNDGKSDIAGRVSGGGQWWVAVSNGTQFTNQLWTTWSTAVTWVDVNTGKF
ncbi:MAG TPA: FG-GAP-like repeat-containing protein [Gemmataceae bacterium]|nr:FG-GAP-like repeat-containing protein [Gemmataceae bacterium]